MAAHQVQARLSPQSALVGSWNMEHGDLVDLVGEVVGSLLEAGEAATTFTFIPDHSPCSLTTPASVAILARAAASCRQLSPPLPPPPSIACSRGKKGPFLASLPVFTNDAKFHCIDGTNDIFLVNLV